MIWHITNRLFRVCLLPYSAPYIPRIPRIIPRYSAPRLIPRLVILGSRNTRNGARNARNAEFRDLAVSFFATAQIDLSVRTRPSIGTHSGHSKMRVVCKCACIYKYTHLHIYIHIPTEPYFPWIHRDRLSAAFRIFRVFRAPSRVFRVLQRRLLFRAFRAIPRHSAPRLIPRRASDSARRGIYNILFSSAV